MGVGVTQRKHFDGGERPTVTVERAAKLVGVSSGTLGYWLGQGLVEFVRVRGRNLVLLDSLYRYRAPHDLFERVSLDTEKHREVANLGTQSRRGAHLKKGVPRPWGKRKKRVYAWTYKPSTNPKWVRHRELRDTKPLGRPKKKEGGHR